MHENDDQAFALLQNMIIPHLKIRDSKSPPKAQVDEASLQQAMDKNKESLKVKLMTRRPINQLVDQGIIPSLKAPPHFHEQRQKLERAKMGDFLKNKIQRRPDRQELIQQHILEDTKIDPSLQDKQRQLKKARLADDLNDRLSHRPGPLELVKGNILHADEKFAQAVKEGQIPFKRTCEGQAVRHPIPSFVLEDDSGSDVALSPPQDVLDQSLSGMSSMDSMALSPYTNQESPTSSMGELRITTSTPPSTLSSPVSAQSGTLLQTEQVPRENVTTVRSRKKSKPKSQPKTRTIKFHEYKGPPSAQKNQTSQSQEETSYELLLQQQQLFLQWHLEWQQKYPQMILPVTHQPSVDQSKSNTNPSQSAEQSQDVSTTSPQPVVSKFEDLKVNDLKAELKKRNLPVSGSKPQLIERLKNHLDSNNSNKIPEKPPVETTVPINVSGIILDTLPTLMAQQEPVASVVTVDSPLNNATPQFTMSEDAALMLYNALPVQGQIVASRPASAAPMDIEMNSNSDAMDCTENANAINENIVKLQQKKIQQLQRELQRSKMQLQQQQWLQQQHQQQQKQQQAQQQVLLATQPVPIAPALPATHIVSTTTLTSIPHPSTVDTKALQKLQQHLQQKFQQQQLLQQLQQPGNGGKFAPGSPAMSAAVKANLAAFIHNQQANSVRMPSTITPVNQQNAAPYTNFKNILLCPQPLQAIVEKPRANSLPNGFSQQKLIWTSSVPNFSNVLPVKQGQIENADLKFVSKKAPPDYNEATKQLTKPKQEKSQSSCKRSGRKSVKSQAVDEVLEILIRNGELPPSAAQEPPTPTTPETQKICNLAPVFTTVRNPSINIGSSMPNENPLQMENQTPHIPSSLDILSVKMEPSSIGQEQNHPPIIFDNSLLLELQNIESMDLGVLDTTDCAPQTSFTDMSQQPQQVINSCLTSSDNDMDVELPDWLEVISNNNPLISTANQPRSSNYNSDPLLPSMANNQEILDMFALDDLDFKAPTDSNTLNWDKVDFAA